jgi:hypothetical protein
MAVRIDIKADPHNPGTRTETAANMDAAARAAIGNGWTCTITRDARPSLGQAERIVAIEAGKVTSNEPDDDVAWWNRPELGT